MKGFKMRITALVLVIIILCAVSGCTHQVQGENLMKDIQRNEVVGDKNVAVSGADISDFAIRLLKACNKDGENILISPMSVLAALSMTANGASEDTLKQMEEVMGLNVERLNHYFYGYMKALPNEEKCKLNLANSIWVTDHERFTVKPTFLQLNADFYNADIYKVPFDKTTVNDMNNWVKNETDGMIPRIVNEIPKQTVLCLINALAFEAEWGNIYKTNQIREGIFTREDWSSQTVEFMNSEEGSYLEDEHAKGVLKYYHGSQFAFVALLPDEGMSVNEYINSLTGERLHHILETRQTVCVRTSIPKFKSEYSKELSKILCEMGMRNAFDEDKANLTELGSSTRGNLYIDSVLHKTFISVDEKGTKAGAATVVAVGDKASSMPEEPKVVRLDRPFVYLLIDTTTNVPFFIGTLMEVE